MSIRYQIFAWHNFLDFQLVAGRSFPVVKYQTCNHLHVITTDVNTCLMKHVWEGYEPLRANADKSGVFSTKRHTNSLGLIKDYL